MIEAYNTALYSPAQRSLSVRSALDNARSSVATTKAELANR